jgi:hypothetical protein
LQERRANDTTTQATRPDQLMPSQGGTALVDRGMMSDFERRWAVVQGDFVEDPRRALGEAEKLLAEFMESVAKGLRERRGDSDRARAGEPDTEAMRIELRRYREIMHRVAGGGQTPAEPLPGAPDTNRPKPTH